MYNIIIGILHTKLKLFCSLLPPPAYSRNRLIHMDQLTYGFNMSESCYSIYEPLYFLVPITITVTIATACANPSSSPPVLSSSTNIPS